MHTDKTPGSLSEGALGERNNDEGIQRKERRSMRE